MKLREKRRTAVDNASPASSHHHVTTMTSNSNNLSWLSPVIYNILVVETGERFAYFGFRAVLVLYFTQSLQFDDRKAIALFAYTTCLAYLSPLVGALLADGKFGRYSIILWFGQLYAVGLVILTLAASSLLETLFWKRLLSFAGLFLVCLGTGGIKPCVSSFGADQVVAMHASSASSNGKRKHSDNEHDFREPLEELAKMTDSDEVIVVDPRESTPSEMSGENVRAFFAYFYFCINLGAVTSIAIVPILRGSFGFGAAFFLPSLFMMGAILLFWSKRYEYVHNNPKEGGGIQTTFRICWWLFQHNLWAQPWFSRNVPSSWRPSSRIPTQGHGEHRLVPSDDVDGDDLHENDEGVNEGVFRQSSDARWEQQLDDAAQALHVLPIMAMFPIFWCLYDQQSSVWTLQATRMELHGLQPEQLNIVNPLEIMIFIPLFDKVIYPAMQERGINIQPLRRMAYGMVLTAIAFFASGLVERAIQHGEEQGTRISVFWQLWQITILAVGEIFLSITGLEFAYSSSPDRLKAFVMAIYLLTTAIGDFFGGVLYSTLFAKLNLATVMNVCAVFMLLNLVLFVQVSKWFDRSTYRDLRRTASLEGLELQSQQGN